MFKQLDLTKLDSEASSSVKQLIRLAAFVAIFSASAVVLYDFVLELHTKCLYATGLHFGQTMLGRLSMLAFFAALNVFIVEPTHESGGEQKISFRNHWTRSGPVIAMVLVMGESMIDDALGSPAQLLIWFSLTVYAAFVTAINLINLSKSGMKPWLYSAMAGALLGGAFCAGNLASQPIITIVIGALSGITSSIAFRILLLKKRAFTQGTCAALAVLLQLVVFFLLLTVWRSLSTLEPEIEHVTWSLVGRTCALALGWGFAFDSHPHADEIFLTVSGAKTQRDDRSSRGDVFAVALYVLLFAASGFCLMNDARTLPQAEKEHIQKVEEVETQLRKLELER